MRIKQITVTHLFGIFDTIHLNREERITIIYGKNGFGKTSILRLVNGFFHLKYSVLLDLTHKVFRISKESLAYYLPKSRNGYTLVSKYVGKLPAITSL